MVTAAAPSRSTRARRVRGYGQSSAYSLGVEEEFQLVDPATFELVPVIDAVLAPLAKSERAQVKHELMQSVVETSTTVCASVDEAEADLRRLRTRVGELAGGAGAVIASAGTTPISRWDDQLIADKPRYREIVERMQWIARRELIFGLHVHVGVDSADKCMYVFNAIRADLPLLLALSANSPFWQGEATGLQSSRIKVFDAFPRSGMPPELPGGWDEWEELLARGAKSGLIPDHTYIWWDVRPHPDFGTIEVRICDAQSRVEDTVGLAALVQALVAWHGDRFDAGEPLGALPPKLLIDENRWSAARYGMCGQMIDHATDELVPTRTLVSHMLDRVEPVAERLGSSAQLGHVSRMVLLTGAERQLGAFRASDGDLRAVGAHLVAETVGH